MRILRNTHSTGAFRMYDGNEFVICSRSRTVGSRDARAGATLISRTEDVPGSRQLQPRRTFPCARVQLSGSEPLTHRRLASTRSTTLGLSLRAICSRAVRPKWSPLGLCGSVATCSSRAALQDGAPPDFVALSH